MRRTRSTSTIPWPTLALALFALAPLGGCGRSDSSSFDRTQLRVAGSGADLGQPDPHVSTKSQDKFLFGLLYDGLVRFKPGRADAESIEPDVAERWSVSDDKMTWTFYLRPDVRFHGSDRLLTAADIVYSLERVADPSRSSAATDYAVIDTVRALDPHTVQVILKQPAPYLLGLVSNYQGGMIVAAPKDGEPNTDAIGAPVGTGPFYVADYQPRRFVLLRANVDYFRGRPQLDSILYRFVDSDVSRELASINGELDLFLGVREGRWVQRIGERQRMHVDVFGPAELRTLHIDASKPPLNDIRVRRAIAHAIDRDRLVQFVGTAVARAAISPLPRGYSGYTENLPLHRHDLELARALLKEAGYPRGFTLPVLISRQRAFLNPMLAIQEQLRGVGIRLDLQVLEHSTFHERIRKRESALVYYGAARFPAADLYLPAFFRAGAGPLNFSGCSVADSTIDAALKEPQTKLRNQLWARAQREILEQVCGIPLFELQQVWARSDAFDFGYELSAAINVSPPLTVKSHLRP